MRHINNAPPNGFGFAVRAGLAAFRGEAVAIVMADGSDSPDDLVAYYRKIQEGYDCVFGSRFIARREGRGLSAGLKLRAEPRWRTSSSGRCSG